MQLLSTAFVIIALVIVSQRARVSAQDGNGSDLDAEETKNRAVTIIDGPTYVTQPNQTKPSEWTTNNTHKPEQKPPSKPFKHVPDKPAKQKYLESPRIHPSHAIRQVPPPRQYPKTKTFRPHLTNGVHKFPRVIPLPPHHANYYYTKHQRQPIFAASTGKPVFASPPTNTFKIGKSPKFSLPTQTINGIPSDFVRPPKLNNITESTTIPTTTTQRILRTKRIWPKHVLHRMNLTSSNTTEKKVNTTTDKSGTESTDQNTAASYHRYRYIAGNGTSLIISSTTPQPSTSRGYRRVTRIPKVKYIPASNFTRIEPNDWIPIVPSHHSRAKNIKRPPKPIGKRSDMFVFDPEEEANDRKMMYLPSYGLVPMKSSFQTPVMARKKMVLFRKRPRHVNYVYSGYRPHVIGDLQSEASYHPKVTKIKHHHHHHHHRYIKTVEKPVKVPYKVEVPKPYPVTVEKKIPIPFPVEKIKLVDKPMPYPVTIEKRVPYPVEVKVPHPVPVKVVEKEYIPKPYPIIHHVPVIKHVEVKVPQPVPVTVEKKVPYPVQVPVPVDRPFAVPVTVEKQVPYPVPVKVLIPQPYPVEKKVPYPVEVKVKEPVEVIKHVPVKVPYPHPVPVKVPVAVPYEKKVPYPVEVEKKIPVPVEVFVPQRVEVEKKVPVYVPRPYPVEKQIPVPVQVPYPVEVPVKIPVYIPHPYNNHNEQHVVTAGVTVSDDVVTSTPHHTVTVHGNSGFKGFQSRSDVNESDFTTETTTTNQS